MIERAPHRLERQSTGRKFIRLASEVLALAFVATNWIATQYAAAVMRYVPFLSGHLIGHLYQPFGWYWWEHLWPRNGLRIGNRILFLAPVWRNCEHLVLYPLLTLGGITALCALFLLDH